ncbi:MAG: DNA-directed DNA polymerase I [Ignisphaera sp.]|nr:DNA-directed DNA polymerase I [Ignisphaera sp.]MCX8168160.1 DNA-directed DNA polymerase I [Ignisphaera sp.]MDW8085200.1 DNA-directed DNA polymerase I [Ignisphaera sp.]
MSKNRSLLEFTKSKKRSGISGHEVHLTSPSSPEGKPRSSEEMNAASSVKPSTELINNDSPTEILKEVANQVRKPAVDSVLPKIYETSNLRVEIAENIDIENPRTIKINVAPNIADKVDNAYLMQVDYDGDTKKAVLIFYNTNTHELIHWYDKTGHKPYFLTDIPPDKVNRISEITRHSSFESVEIIEKFNPLNSTKRSFTKIVTKDPAAVRTLRTRVPIAWEANIRYHINYIYDRQLVPGLPYAAHADKILEMYDVSIKDLEENTVKMLAVSPESTEIAIHFLKLFETKWFTPKRIAIDIEVYTPFEGRIPSPDAAEYPIISVALASNDSVRKTLILYRENLRMLKELMCDSDIEIYESEYSMMLDLISIISQYPIVVTFNGDNFDIRYLYVRMLKLGIPKELIGIKVKKVVKGGKIEFEAKFSRALHIDLYKFFSNKAIQVYAFEGKYKEVNLDSVAQALLGIGKVQLDEELGKIDLSMLVHYNFRDADVTLKLTTFSDELVWKLMLLLMRISKLGLEDVCRSTVSVWIKNLFYWEHRRRGYLIPRQEDIQSLKGRKVTEATIKGKKYAGAIVIEPPQGLFFNVVVLDFASLYPSIMKQWNLSYETIDPNEESCSNMSNIIDETNNVIHRVCRDRPGLTAEIVGMLRDFRVKIYKKKAKDKNINEMLRSWYDTVQRAMKVFINAAYGVFGADTFPLYAPSVAESVTALGRRIITYTIKRAEELGLRVLYGDTDSLFIWNPEQSKLEELKKWVEETFGLELEMDKRYKFVAFALKKNYVGITPSNEVDIKGMMGKKRNTPDFIKTLFVEILKKMTSIEEPEDAFKIINSVRDDLEKYYLLLKYKLLTLDEVAFHMGLSKPLSEYKKTTPQHVKAALMLQRYNVNISPGDVITFVKVKSKDGVKPIQLAKISEIDTQKYLEAMVSTLEQLFTALNISWEDITGGGRLPSR